MTAFTLLAGILIGLWLPDSVRVWVRGVAGKAWGAFFGARPAQNSNRQDNRQVFPEVGKNPVANQASEQEFQPEKKPENWGRALTNILGFFLRYWQPIVLVIIAVVIISAFRGCSLPFDGKSKDALRLERELAEANTRLAQHETRLGELSRDLAVNTERDARRRATVIAQAEQEIEDATAQVDAQAQHGAYVRGYLCVLDTRACEGGADPAPSGTAPVRGALPDTA